MALINKLEAIADGFRSSRKITDKLTLDQMAEYAAEGTVESISHASIPDYVKSAALEVARKVNEVRDEDSIVFLAMSDSHHTGEQSDTSWQEYTNLGNLHAGMAAKVLSYVLDMDFVCHLGDITFGNSTTTSELLHQQIGEMNSWLDEAYKGIPQFRTVGNHDTGMYAYEAGIAEMETNDYLFSVIGSYCEGATYGSEEFGYCYRDFDDKKTRVICLNTSEGDSIIGSNYACSPTQLLWFAQTLYDVGSKTDASDWCIVVLGHYPLDYPNMAAASSVVKAYVEGGSTTQNGTTIDFSSSNGAKFVAQFHGHTHCFKYAKLNELDTTALTATEYDAWRVAVPNSGFYRNNHQAGPNSYGLYFNEDVTYDKTYGGAEDTAFVINVVVPSKETIYSFCYGAGYDRIIGYGATIYHVIKTSLSNCTISNTVASVENGKAFAATITPDEHCTISSATITMGGIDITSSVYNNGEINIPEVTGEVVITVKAELALDCTNQIPISTDTDGSIYSEDGYAVGKRLDSSGEAVSYSGNSYTTGFIPVVANDIVYLKNVHFEATATGSLTTGNQRMCFYDENKTFIGLSNSGSTTLQNRVYEDNNMVRFTVSNTSEIDASKVAYFRINAAYIGADSIITVNEEIKYADSESGSGGTVEGNVIPTSIDTDGNVFNGTGYMDGYYLNSSGEPAADAVITITGFIPFVFGDSITITGGTWDNASNCRISMYDADMTHIQTFNYNAAMDSRYGGATLSENGVYRWYSSKLSSSIASGSGAAWSDIAYIRFCCKGTGANLVALKNVEEVKYNITKNLTNATIDNTVTEIHDGEPCTINVGAAEGYTLDTVQITMGGTDITDAVYSDGLISIPAVTGDVVITVIATGSVSYTNLVPTATTPVTSGSAMSTEIYNGIGYANNTRLSGLSHVANDGYVATGIIQWREAVGAFSGLKPIYIRGATLDTSRSYVRLVTIRTNDGTKQHLQVQGNTWATYFTVETLGDNYYKLTPIEGDTSWYNVTHFMVSLYGSGENLIITVDEPIE